jgi:hypothetical protein
MIYDVLGCLKLGYLPPIQGHVDRENDDKPSNLEVPYFSKNTCRILTDSSKAVPNIEHQKTSPSFPNCPAKHGWKLMEKFEIPR